MRHPDPLCPHRGTPMLIGREVAAHAVRRLHQGQDAAGIGCPVAPERGNRAVSDALTVGQTFVSGIVFAIIGQLFVRWLGASIEYYQLGAPSLTGRYETEFQNPRVKDGVATVEQLTEVLELAQLGHRIVGDSKLASSDPAEKREWTFEGKVLEKGRVIVGTYQDRNPLILSAGVFFVEFRRTPNRYTGSWMGYANQPPILERGRYEWHVTDRNWTTRLATSAKAYVRLLSR